MEEDGVPAKDAVEDKATSLWMDMARGSAKARGMDVSNEFEASVGIVYKSFARTLARDVLRFAKHAEREEMISEDVFLCARRNPSLESELRHRAERKQKP